MLEYCKGQPAPFANVKSQNKFLRINDGDIGADHLFQYEQWDKVITYLEGRLKFKITLKEKNVWPPMNLTLLAKTEAKLREKRAAEFEVWELGRR
ncbi:MAG: hypothetical protein ACJAZ1_000796 [Yoonia sp.]|jgi:hypothetical protein